MWQSGKIPEPQAPVVQTLDSAIRCLNNWGQHLTAVKTNKQSAQCYR